MDFIFPGRFSPSVKIATLVGAFGGIVYLGWWAEKHGYLNQPEEEEGGQQRRYAHGRGGGAEEENEVQDESSFVHSLATFLDEVQGMIDNPRPVNTPQELEQMFMVVARTYAQVKQFAELLSKITAPDLQDKKQICYVKIQKLVHSLEAYRGSLVEKANRYARSHNTIEDEEEEEESRVTEIVETKKKEKKPAVTSGVFTLDDDDEEAEEEGEEELKEEEDHQVSTSENHSAEPLPASDDWQGEERFNPEEEYDFSKPIEMRGENADITSYIMAALAAEMEQTKEEFLEEYEGQYREEEDDEPRVEELAVD